jgi:7,8-dihydropterin-6-yl-methyl-4-(beta-D-ribofuranosyl)aminobenzene 5'-phosphate synthase
MAKNILVLSLVILFSITYGIAQKDASLLSKDEINEMYKAIDADSNLAKFIKIFGDPVELYKNYKTNLRVDDSIWTADQKKLQKIKNIGNTDRFEFIPLIDWFTLNNTFRGEGGVSYLIITDSAIILFDLGYNEKEEDPSPLLLNMEKLNISIEDIDVIVISHDHGDHVGGDKWEAGNTFSLTNHQIDLGKKPVYTPKPMSYPGLEPIYSPDPVKITEGVATIGVIKRPLFFANVEEQALAVNVKNKGIIIISGCGHQTIEKIIQRTEVLFDEPIYGILGGFHLPMSEERNISWIYKYVVTGKLPWERLTADDIDKKIDLLRQEGVKIVGISAHDSCDSTINAFRRAFQSSYKDIIVGDKIIVE